MVGLCYCPQAFSSCSEQGLLCLRCTGFSLQWLLFGAQALGAWTSIVVVMSELSSCRSQALGMQAQKSWCMGLVVLQHVGSSWTRNQTSGVPCITGWILNPWTTREAPVLFLNSIYHSLKQFCINILSSWIISMLWSPALMWASWPLLLLGVLAHLLQPLVCGPSLGYILSAFAWKTFPQCQLPHFPLW